MTVNEVGGRCSLEWLSSLPPADMYHVTTDRFWAEQATIIALPKYFHEAKEPSTVQDIVKIANAIDCMISSRISSGGNEIRIQHKFDADCFDNVLLALQNLKNIQHVTGLFASNKDERVILIINNRYPILVTTNLASDCTLPVLDLDDGFSQNVFGSAYIPTEWKEAFDLWSSKLKATNYDSWDEDLF